MFLRVLYVLVDIAVASAPVSSLNTMSWLFILIVAVHEVPPTSWMVSRKLLFSSCSSETAATTLLRHTVL